jgi:CheY-like chemotaxis protein
LVELMDGTIDVDSRLGEGSTFHFTARFGAVAEGVWEEPQPLTGLQGMRCLVVDDNETNQRIVEYQTAAWGMQTESADSGPQALTMMRLAAARHEPFDVVLLDMHMPGMDGVELARAIKGEPGIAGATLVMLASMSPQEHGYDVNDVDIKAYLTKPVKQLQLYDCLLHVMAADQGGPARPEETGAGPEKTTRRMRGRVLVAEDNRINQRVAVRMIEKRDFQVDVVGNGHEAVAALRQTEYALVFMDCQMPEMDGYEAAREIRRLEAEGALPARTPIIAMTANAMQGDAEKCLAAGMDGYVAKPVTPKVVGAVLDEWTAGSKDAAATSA